MNHTYQLFNWIEKKKETKSILILFFTNVNFFPLSLIFFEIQINDMFTIIFIIEHYGCSNNHYRQLYVRVLFNGFISCIYACVHYSCFACTINRCRLFIYIHWYLRSSVKLFFKYTCIYFYVLIYICVIVQSSIRNIFVYIYIYIYTYQKS